MRCIDINPQGFLVDANVAIDACTSFVLMESSEWSQYPTLLSIFAMPIESDIQTAFMVGFGLPVIAYLSSWAYQTVIDFATKQRY